MSLGLAPGIRGVHGFPRVSGDEPDDITNLRPAHQFSPRERG